MAGNCTVEIRNLIRGAGNEDFSTKMTSIFHFHESLSFHVLIHI